MHFYYDRLEINRHNKKYKKWKHRYRFIRNLIKTFRKHTRSIRSEQETLFAHIHALFEASNFHGFSIIFESDIRLNEGTGRNFVDFFKYLNSKEPNAPLYCDLAGGCERSSIMNSWAFENGNGVTNVRINNNLTAHFLPTLINNTAGGYLVNHMFAKNFYEFLISRQTLCPIDFCFNLYAFENFLNNSSICVHFTPLIFQQGSATGDYQSSPTLFER